MDPILPGLQRALGPRWTCTLQKAFSSSSSSLLDETRAAWDPNQKEQPAAGTSGSSDTAPSSSSSSPEVQRYVRQHAAVVSDVVQLLQRLGLKPGQDCVVGEGLATIDIGFMAGHPPRQVAIDITPSPSDFQPASDGPPGTGPASLASSSSISGGPLPARPGHHTPAQRYAQAAVRRQLLAAHGWVAVQVPLVEYAGIMADAAAQQQQQPPPGGQGTQPGGGSAGSAGAAAEGGDGVKARYLELLLQQAVEEYDAARWPQQQHSAGHHHHHHHHHQHEGGSSCGPGCSH